jgi:hypothetical protein
LPLRCNNWMPAWLQHRRRLLYRPELRKRSSLCRHGLCHRRCLSRRLHLRLRSLRPQSLHFRLGLLERLRRRRVLQHARDVRWLDGVMSLVEGMLCSRGVRRASPFVPTVLALVLYAGCGGGSDTIGGTGARGGSIGDGMGGGAAGTAGRDSGLDSSMSTTACRGDSECGSGQYCMNFSVLCSGAPDDYTLGVGTCHRDCSSGACSCGDNADCRPWGECYPGGCVALPIPPCVEEPSSCPAGCTLEQASDRVCGPVCRCDVCPAADGGSNVDALSTDATNDKQALPQCGWPTSLNEAGPGGCRASHALVSCNGPAGGCSCTSDDATTCPTPTTCGLAHGYTTCQDRCADNEYAVACGGLPQPDAASVDQQPPGGCRLALATPGGEAFYCCPCE